MSDKLEPGMSYNDLKKAKIYSMASGKLLHDTTAKKPAEVDTSDPNHLFTAANLPQGHPARKKPMLVVGANSHIRERHPKIVGTHDIHLLFNPQAKPVWKVGAVVTNRQTNHSQYVEHEHRGIGSALEGLHEKIESAAKRTQGGHTFNEHTRRHMENLIYRQPKIAFNDIRKLEPYDPDAMDRYNKEVAESQNMKPAEPEAPKAEKPKAAKKPKAPKANAPKSNVIPLKPGMSWNDTRSQGDEGPGAA